MTREAAIAAVLGEVQERWGIHSLTRGYAGARGSGLLASRAAQDRPAPSLPPWWPGAEGYLRPNILELSGPASCGKLGIALLWLAAASRGGLVAVVDLAGTFYPPAAAAAGLDLDQLVVVRPPDRRGAVEAVSLLLSSAGFDAVLWPLEWRTRPFNIDSVRLSTLAVRSNTTLLALVTDHRRATSPTTATSGQDTRTTRPRTTTTLGEDTQATHPGATTDQDTRTTHPGGIATDQDPSGDAARLFPSADLRLRVIGWEWTWRDGELAGVRPRARTERLRGALAGQSWELQLEHHAPAAQPAPTLDHSTSSGTLWERGHPGRFVPSSPTLAATHETSTRQTDRPRALADERGGGPTTPIPSASTRHPAPDAPADARPGRCPPTDHLCLAAALPLGGGSTRTIGPPGTADLSVRPDQESAPVARTA